MSDHQHSHDKLEERVRMRSEKRRKRALDGLPVQLPQAALELSPIPTIVYENNQVSYANPAAIAKLGYTYEQLMTFNDLTLDTGTRKERLDNILKPCAEQGWDELDLELNIATLDKQELRLRPHLRHQRIGQKDYWVAYIMHAEKINQNTFKGKAINALHKVFQRDRAYLKAPERIEKDFIIAAIRKGVDSSVNLVIDLKRTQRIDKEVLPILYEFSNGSSFKDHLFLINASEIVYHFLMHHKIPSETIYRATKQAYALAPI